MRSFGFALVGAFLWLVARTGAAQPDGDFDVRVQDCPPDLAERLPAVVQLEVRVLVRERRASGPFVQRIDVRCEGDTARIDATVGGARRTSSVDSRGVAPEHRARALGLAAAEIVDAMWNEEQGTDERAAAQPAKMDRPEPARVPPPAERASTAEIGLGGVIERAGRPAALVAGGRLGVALRVSELFAPVLSVDALAGEASTDPAAVGIRSVSAAAHLLVGRGAGTLSWGLGPGVHAGWVRLEGKPATGSSLEGQSVSGWFAGPALRARIAWSSRGSGLVPFAALEGDAGLVLLPVRGMQDNSRRVFSMDGPWLSLALSAGASF